MTDPKACPKCGTELPADAPAGICPKCLMQAGIEGGPSSARVYFASEGPFSEAPPVAEEPIRPEELDALLPQFEVLELLGRGGMGAVYKARQPSLDRIIALKVIRQDLAKDPGFAERFSREARALARLSHQSIVTVHDFGQAGSLCYLVMEYVDGANLRSLIRDAKLKPEEALKIVPQICEALQFAHDEGIVHRDIKPENILIDKKGRVKIADFGLAKLLGHAKEDLSLTGTGQLMGTLGYMAPEQLQQAHAVDHRADIYSLGVVFYEMLTGQLPIGRFEPPSKKVQVDVRLDEIVLRSLESEPGRRYQHASDVKTDVETITGGVRPRKTTPDLDASEESRRRDEVAAKEPLWVGVGAFGTFVVGWIFMGAMWNLRQGGMALAITVLAVLTYCVLRRKINFLPQLRAELSRQSSLRKAISLALGFAVFVWAMFAVSAAHLNVWNAANEITGRDSLSVLPPITRGEEAFEKFPLDKLNYFNARRDTDLEISSTGGMFVAIDAWSTAIWYLCLAFALMVFVVQTVIDTRRFRNTWKYFWGPSLSTTALLFAALLPAHFIRCVHWDKDFPLMSAKKSSYGARNVRDPSTSIQIASAIENWADSNAYVPRQDRSWTITKKTGTETIGKIHMVELRPIRPFDAWHIGLGGPAWRPLPPLNITWIATDNPPEAFVSIDPGMIIRDTQEMSTWPAVIDSLEATIHSGSPVTSEAVNNLSAANPGWLVAFVSFGMLVGIGSLLVLSRPEVTAAFRTRRTKESSGPRITNADTAHSRPAIDQVKAPAIGLLVAGSLGFVDLLVATLIALGILIETSTSPALAAPLSGGEWLLFLGLASFGFVRNALVTFGALKMKHVEWFRAAMTGSLFALMPNSSAFLIVRAYVIGLQPGVSNTMPKAFIVLPMFVFGLGLLIGLLSGVWALTVLTRPGVKAAFSPTIRDKNTPSAIPTDQVRIPAIGLIITGSLHTACFLFIVMPLGIERLLLLATTTVGVLIVVGGTKMLRMRSQAWATTASILALLPVGPGWVLGAPMGIWSLVVLSRPEVKAVFRKINEERAALQKSQHLDQQAVQEETRAPHREAPTSPPAAPVSPQASQVPRVASAIDRFFRSALPRLVTTTTGWAILFSIAGIVNGFNYWNWITIETNQGAFYWALPGFATGLGLVAAATSFSLLLLLVLTFSLKPTPVWRSIVMLLAALIVFAAPWVEAAHRPLACLRSTTIEGELTTVKATLTRYLPLSTRMYVRVTSDWPPFDQTQSPPRTDAGAILATLSAIAIFLLGCAQLIGMWLRAGVWEIKGGTVRRLNRPDPTALGVAETVGSEQDPLWHRIRHASLAALLVTAAAWLATIGEIVVQEATTTVRLPDVEDNIAFLSFFVVTAYAFIVYGAIQARRLRWRWLAIASVSLLLVAASAHFVLTIVGPNPGQLHLSPTPQTWFGIWPRLNSVMLTDFVAIPVSIWALVVFCSRPAAELFRSASQVTRPLRWGTFAPLVAVGAAAAVSWIAVTISMEGLTRTQHHSRSFGLGKSSANVHQFGDHVGLAVWIDQGESYGAAYGDVDSGPGYVGDFLLSRNRRLYYSCVTGDGKHGTVSFILGLHGNGLPGSPFQLVNGRLFLIRTAGDQITIRQLNPDLSGISNTYDGLAEGVAKVQALAESDQTVKSFLAGSR